MPSTTVMSLSVLPDEGRIRESQSQMSGARIEVQCASSQHKNGFDLPGHKIEAWLCQSYPCNSSESTTTIYRRHLTSLCSYLQTQGLDLDSPKPQLTQQIHAWASQRTPGSKHQGNVSASTYNQRIAAVNSFYTWASQCGLYSWSNPAEPLSRTTIRKYARSYAMNLSQVRKQLEKIDCSTARGQRDYVLLQVALNTGRSASELASLTWGNIFLQENNATLAFKGVRNGKIMYNTLDTQITQILLTYLHTIYGENLTVLCPHTPIWISFSDRTSNQAIGQQTIADICEAHLGSSKVYRLRHTFALSMDQLGMPVGAIQNRLGHESRATTNAYLARLRETYRPGEVLQVFPSGLEKQ